MTSYETIFTRRSVRKYLKDPIDQPTLEGIQRCLDEALPLSGQKAGFRIVSGSATGGNYPYAILAYCEKSDPAYINVGYILEKADLYIQSIGLGSLWLGMAKPAENQSDFCIMLAFGKTDVPARKNVQEFNRLPIGEISNMDNAVSDAARLAPSAVNTQPWMLHFSDNAVQLRYIGRGMMKLVLKKRLNKIDLGIVTRHIVTALRHEGKTIQEIRIDPTGKELTIDIPYSSI